MDEQDCTFTNPAWRQEHQTLDGYRALDVRVAGSGTAQPLPMTETQKRAARKREKEGKTLGFGRG